MTHRKLDHRDANEPAIIAALTARGCIVWPLSQGDGTPDLLCATPRRGGRRHYFTLEVKNPAHRDSSKLKLRPKQQVYADLFTGAPHFKVQTASEALAAVRQVLKGDTVA